MKNDLIILCFFVLALICNDPAKAEVVVTNVDVEIAARCRAFYNAAQMTTGAHAYMSTDVLKNGFAQFDVLTNELAQSLHLPARQKDTIIHVAMQDGLRDTKNALLIKELTRTFFSENQEECRVFALRAKTQNLEHVH